MSSFNFKSSGFKTTDRIVTNVGQDPAVRPIGIKTPLEFSKKSGRQLFHMNDNPVIHLKDNLRNLLLTEKGERLGMPEYGCGIRDFLFDLTSIPDYESVIIGVITEQIETYMPFLQINNIEILDYANAQSENELKNRGDMAAILLRIVFDIPRLKIGDQRLEVVIFSGG